MKAWALTPHPTLHEDAEHVPQDGERGSQNEQGEQEGADGIRDFVLGLKHTQRLVSAVQIQHTRGA